MLVFLCFLNGYSVSISKELSLSGSYCFVDGVIWKQKQTLLMNKDHGYKDKKWVYNTLEF